MEILQLELVIIVIQHVKVVMEQGSIFFIINYNFDKLKYNIYI